MYILCVYVGCGFKRQGTQCVLFTSYWYKVVRALCACLSVSPSLKRYVRGNNGC